MTSAPASAGVFLWLMGKETSKACAAVRRGLRREYLEKAKGGSGALGLTREGCAGMEAQ